MRLLLVTAVSFVVRKSPKLSKNRCFRYPATFHAVFQGLFDKRIFDAAQVFRGATTSELISEGNMASTHNLIVSFKRKHESRVL